MAETQAHLPWFWSPPMEGFFEIPYTFESDSLFRVVDSHGQDKKKPLHLRLERTAVLGGIFNRCLSENGVSPCSPSMLAVYQQSNDKIVFGPEQKAAVREHRLTFWKEFPKAFRFESLPGNRFRFVPNREYKPDNRPQVQLLASIQGEISFDPGTAEVTAMSYDVLRDVEIPGRRLVKGMKYVVTLTKAGFYHYVPSRLSFEQPSGKDRATQVEDYSNYRKCRVDTNLQFGDVPEPVSPR